VEQLRTVLCSLTKRICGELEGLVIENKPIWTVVNQLGVAPHVALDVERPALSNLRLGIRVGLLKLSEYAAVAEAIQNDPELKEGIIITADGFLREPEPINFTRALVENFLWRYLREGIQLGWDETRFTETFNELRDELRRKTIDLHATLPLSNLKMDIDALDFGDELKLLPASIEELERWINRDRSLPPLGAGPPEWNNLYIDKPAVLHAHQLVVGRPPSTDPGMVLNQLSRVNADHVVTALRLVMNAPISVIFQEHDSEGLMAFGGRSISWGWTPPLLGPLAILDQDKATQVKHVWQRLKTSHNIKLLGLPVRRWESSLLRPNLEDRLLDAWISLESLFLKVKDGELKYRAAIRLGEFLGTDGVNRKAIYDTAKISYDWRSVIVHGGSSKEVAKRQSLQESVKFTTEYLRSVLLKILDLPDKFDPNTLESQLLSRDAETPQTPS
jgi:hypothetical protein